MGRPCLALLFLLIGLKWAARHRYLAAGNTRIEVGELRTSLATNTSHAYKAGINATDIGLGSSASQALQENRSKLQESKNASEEADRTSISREYECCCCHRTIESGTGKVKFKCCQSRDRVRLWGFNLACKAKSDCVSRFGAGQFPSPDTVIMPADFCKAQYTMLAAEAPGQFPNGYAPNRKQKSYEWFATWYGWAPGVPTRRNWIPRTEEHIKRYEEYIKFNENHPTALTEGDPMFCDDNTYGVEAPLPFGRGQHLPERYEDGALAKKIITLGELANQELSRAGKEVVDWGKNRDGKNVAKHNVDPDSIEEFKRQRKEERAWRRGQGHPWSQAEWNLYYNVWRTMWNTDFEKMRKEYRHGRQYNEILDNYLWTYPREWPKQTPKGFVLS